MLKEIKNPQDRLKYIHIGGTNGKGSVSTFCASILKRAGFKVGLFRSPHVMGFCERMEINRKKISKKDLVLLVERLREINEELKKEMVILTVFDFITVLALEYFSSNDCDVVVLEVGLGGKLDATNVISSALVTILTHIDYDHIKELSVKIRDVVEITKEKAGILKDNGVFVCDNHQYPQVLEFLEKKSAEQNVKFIKSYQPYNVKFYEKFTTFYFNNTKFKIKLLGEHQVENAMIAVTAALNLKIPIKTIKKGLKETFIPAKFEVVKKKPMIVLDGAHNENSVESLMKTISKFQNKPKIGVVSISRAKDFDRMLEKIGNAFDFVIFTKMINFMAINPFVLYKKALRLKFKCTVEASFKKAIELSKQLALKNGIIVFFGSLYFVSDVRHCFKTYKNY